MAMVWGSAWRVNKRHFVTEVFCLHYHCLVVTIMSLLLTFDWPLHIKECLKYLESVKSTCRVPKLPPYLPSVQGRVNSLFRASTKKVLLPATQLKSEHFDMYIINIIHPFPNLIRKQFSPHPVQCSAYLRTEKINTTIYQEKFFSQKT